MDPVASACARPPRYGVRRAALGSLADSLAFGLLKQRSPSPERLAARASGSPAVLGGRLAGPNPVARPPNPLLSKRVF